MPAEAVAETMGRAKSTRPAPPRTYGTSAVRWPARACGARVLRWRCAQPCRPTAWCGASSSGPARRATASIRPRRELWTADSAVCLHRGLLAIPSLAETVEGDGLRPVTWSYLLRLRPGGENCTGSSATPPDAEEDTAACVGGACDVAEDATALATTARGHLASSGTGAARHGHMRRQEVGTVS